MKRCPALSAPNLKFLARGCAVLLVSGCAVGPDHVRPELELPEQFSGLSPESSAADSKSQKTSEELIGWWKKFNDSELNQIVEQSLKENLSLQSAISRIRQARAEQTFGRAGLFPMFGSSGQYQRQRLGQRFDFSSGSGSSSTGESSISGGIRETYSAGLDLSWELDVFGGVRRAAEAADSAALAEIYKSRGILVSITAEVAATYLDLKTTQRLLDVARKNVAVQERTLELTKSRFTGGLGTQLDVARAEAQLANTAAEIPTLEAEQNRLMNALGVLLGQTPESIHARLSNSSPTIMPPPAVPAGLPSELLRRRPDILQAEYLLAAASSQVGVAISDWFPKFSLTGDFGSSSREFSDLGKSSSEFWSIGPSIRWPIFQGGKIVANIEIKEEQQKQAVLAYKETVLQALEETENSLVSLEKEQVRHEQLTKGVKANEHAVRLAKDLFNQGLVDFLNVLEAEGALFQAESALARSDGLVLKNVVLLFKALGGGWQDYLPEDEQLLEQAIKLRE